jgi:peptidoglycan/xylan/chitin deacetylase (PgdA/CDA1 family)
MKLLLASLVYFCVSISLANIKVAITVDDLPTHGKLPIGTTREEVARKMLSIFKKHGVPDATAYINMGKVDVKNESFPVLQMWKDAGYTFGNHTYLHEDINFTSAADYEKAIALNGAGLKKLSGDNNWKTFRYPYLREGDTLEKRNAIRKYLTDNGYQIAQVTIDFEDWAWNDPYARCFDKKDKKAIKWLKHTYLQNATDMLTRAEVLSKSLFNRSIPHILLLHIGAFDAEMFDQMLTSYKKMGVEFITIAEANRDEVYSMDPGLAAKYGSELTYQVMKARKLELKDVGLTKYQDYPEDKLAKICR